MRLGRFSGVLAYIATGVLLSGEAMADKRIAITLFEATVYDVGRAVWDGT